MASRSLNDLHPALKLKCLEHKEMCAHIGIVIGITCTARTLKEQVALYAQGRQTLQEVNALRRVAGLPAITVKENAYKVTWTMFSYHLVNFDDADPMNDKARAYDIVVIKNGIACWDLKVNVNENDIPDYREVAEIGKSIGLTAGADFKNPDYPHFQLDIKR